MNNNDKKSLEWKKLAAAFSTNFLYFLKKGGWAVFLFFFLDLISKLIVWLGCGDAFEGGKVYSIISSEQGNVLGIGLTFNKGMGYGLLENQTVLLACLSALVGVAMIAFLAYRFKKKSPLLRWALYLLIGGDFGNFIDRAFYEKGVVDWIAIGNSSWPSAFNFVCNLADIFLTAGVIVLIIAIIIDAVKEYQYGKSKKAIEKADNEPTAPIENKENISASNSDESLTDLEKKLKGENEKDDEDRKA